MVSVRTQCGFVLSLVLAALVAAETRTLIAENSTTGAPRVPPEIREELLEYGVVGIFVELAKPALDELRSLSRAERHRRIRREKDAWLGTIPREGWELRYDYKASPVFLIAIASEDVLDLLAEDPNVARLEPDLRGEAHLDQSVHQIGGDELHAEGIVGDGRVVAVLDSGADATHPDLAGAVLAEKHFLDQGEDVGPGARDDTQQGHGTHIAGIIASRGTTAPAGVAPGADLVLVKVLDESAVGWVSDWAAGVEYVTELHAEENGIRVDAISMSFGTCDQYRTACDDERPAFALACSEALEAGIALVASSGNTGSIRRISLPACYSSVVSVGSRSAIDRCTSSGFTSRNELLDLLAPGEDITSLAVGGGVREGSGTSQAAPHVSGSIALLREVDPSLSPAILRELLVGSGYVAEDPPSGLYFRCLHVGRALEAYHLPVPGVPSCKVDDALGIAAISWPPIEAGDPGDPELLLELTLTVEGEEVGHEELSLASTGAVFEGSFPGSLPEVCVRVRRGDLAGRSSCTTAELGEAALFVRGDCAPDANLNISDAIASLLLLFVGGEAPPCPASCDANDDGRFDVSDPIRTISFLFLGAPPLPPPFPGCGFRNSEDPFDCTGAICP